MGIHICAWLPVRMFVNQNSRRGMWGHKGYQSVDIIWPRVFMNSLINSFKWGQLTAFSHSPNLSPTTALATLNGWLIYLLEIPKVHAAVILRTLHDIDKLNSRSVQDIHCIEGFRWFFSIIWKKYVIIGKTWVTSSVVKARSSIKDQSGNGLEPKWQSC